MFCLPYVCGHQLFHGVGWGSLKPNIFPFVFDFNIFICLITDPNFSVAQDERTAPPQVP